MNAPTNAAALAEPKLKMIALSLIIPSSTHIQEMRRERFDAKVTKELAESIKSVGILQPPVARALAGGKFELVAGERRYLAAKIAGLKEIPLNVRELTDDQVLEVQLVENLQREDLHELEEAEGYGELMKLKKITADEVGAMVGKSRSYVYARTKLLALCQEVRKAFYSGQIDASKALLIARIGNHDTQRQALKDLTEVQKYNKDELVIPTYREARDHIEENYMLRLSEAIFKVDDANLVKKAGACTTCPKRTGNQPDLFPDIKSADVCTDPKCFAEKKAAHRETRKVELVAKGHEVITGTAARKIQPRYSYGSPQEGFVKFDEACDNDPKKHTYRQLLSGSDIKPIMVETEKGSFTAMIKPTDCKAALEKKGITPRKEQRDQPSGPSIEQRVKSEIEEGKYDDIARRKALAVYKAAPAKFGKHELLHLFDKMITDYDFECALELATVLGMKCESTDDRPTEKQFRAKLGTLSESDLVRAFIATTVCNASQYSDRSGPELAKRYKVDFKAIEKAVDKDYKQKIDAAVKVHRAAEAKKKAEAKLKEKAKTALQGTAAAWPFPTGKKVPIGTPKAKAKAKKKPAAKKAKGKKK